MGTARKNKTKILLMLLMAVVLVLSACSKEKAVVLG